MGVLTEEKNNQPPQNSIAIVTVSLILRNIIPVCSLLMAASQTLWETSIGNMLQGYIVRCIEWSLTMIPFLVEVLSLLNIIQQTEAASRGLIPSLH